jgi:hypothetical protein
MMSSPSVMVAPNTLTVYDPLGFNQSPPSGRLVRRRTHGALVERRR